MWRSGCFDSLRQHDNHVSKSATTKRVTRSEIGDEEEEMKRYMYVKDALEQALQDLSRHGRKKRHESFIFRMISEFFTNTFRSSANH